MILGRGLGQWLGGVKAASDRRISAEGVIIIKAGKAKALRKAVRHNSD
ncbi:MAG: hypothetical protein AB1413_04950 [Thermodesulfobacteriota bacterium]